MFPKATPIVLSLKNLFAVHITHLNHSICSIYQDPESLPPCSPQRLQSYFVPLSATVLSDQGAEDISAHYTDLPQLLRPASALQPLTHICWKQVINCKCSATRTITLETFFFFLTTTTLFSRSTPALHLLGSLISLHNLNLSINHFNIALSRISWLPITFTMHFPKERQSSPSVFSTPTHWVLSITRKLQNLLQLTYSKYNSPSHWLIQIIFIFKSLISSNNLFHKILSSQFPHL